MAGPKDDIHIAPDARLTDQAETNVSGIGEQRTRDRYTRVAIILHWMIAILILFNLAIGFFMEGLPPIARKLVVTAHLSSGITILILTFIRLAWRVTHRPPPLLPGLHAWERHLARFVHVLFYAGMIITPLSGWAIISANPPADSPGAAALQQQADAATARGKLAPPARVSGKSRFWWIAPLPPIGPLAEIGARPEGLARQHRLHEQSVELHAYLAYLMIALVFLHVGGALKHQLIDGQPQLARMGLTRRKQADAR